MKNTQPCHASARRNPASRAKSAPGAVRAWICNMTPQQRHKLSHQIRGGAGKVTDVPAIRSRVDRYEAALTVALFLEFANHHNLTPAEADALLHRAGEVGPRTLDLLGLASPPTALPGRTENEHAGHRNQRASTATPGRH